MTIYPFELWFDGRLWILKRDVDFVGSADEFKSVLHQAALFLNKKIDVSITANSITVKARA